MTYDNIKSRKMPGLHPLFRYFKKPQGGNQDDPPPSSPPAVLGLDNCFLCLYIRNEKMLKYNVKFNFEDMVHMPNFLKHLVHGLVLFYIFWSVCYGWLIMKEVFNKISCIS